MSKPTLQDSFMNFTNDVFKGHNINIFRQLIKKDMLHLDSLQKNKNLFQSFLGPKDCFVDLCLSILTFDSSQCQQHQLMHKLATSLGKTADSNSMRQPRVSSVSLNKRQQRKRLLASISNINQHWPALHNINNISDNKLATTLGDRVNNNGVVM